MRPQPSASFGVICAKTEETSELLEIFDNKFTRERGDDILDVTFQVSASTTVVVTTCASMGHVSAAVRTAEVIAARQPSLMVFVGTAASLKPDEIQVGDVVIPKKAVSRVYEKISEAGQRDYDERVTDIDFKERFFDQNALISDITTIDCSPRALTALASLSSQSISLESGPTGFVQLGGKTIDLREPRIHKDVDIFSCGMVIDSVSYREFITLNAARNLRKVSIVDMESYGFFHAIDAISRSPTGGHCTGLMIRGISDYAGRKSATERRPEGWKEKSVRNAAIVTARLLQKLAGS